MAVKITLTKQAFKDKTKRAKNKYNYWRVDKQKVTPGNAILCTSADTKGILTEGPISSTQYVRAISEYRKARVPMMVTSSRPYQQIRDEKKSVWGSPMLIVSNGGAYARDSVGKIYANEKIDPESAKSISKLLSYLAEEGVVSVSTKAGTYSARRSFHKTGIMAHFDPFLDTTFDQEKFDLSLNEARNMSFQITSGSQWTEDKSLTLNFGPITQFLGLPKDFLKFTFVTKFWIPRNILKRQKVRVVDFKKQEEATLNVLNILINPPQPPKPADDASEAEKIVYAEQVKQITKMREHYLENIDVVLTKNGLSFLPKGASKHQAIMDFCEHNRINPNAILLHGDNFDDFFLPVNLKDLRDAMVEAQEEGKKINAFDMYLKLSQPVIADTVQFFDRVNAYKLDENETFATSALKKRLAMLADEHNQTRVLSAKKDKELSIAAQALETVRQKTVKDAEKELIPQIENETDEDKKNELRQQLNEKRDAAQKAFDEGMEKAKELTDKLTINDIEDDDPLKKELKTGTEVDCSMVALRRIFKSFSSVNRIVKIPKPSISESLVA